MKQRKINDAYLHRADSQVSHGYRLPVKYDSRQTAVDLRVPKRSRVTRVVSFTLLAAFAAVATVLAGGR